MSIVLGAELADCWLKIGRAEEHAKTVSDEITAWDNGEPYHLSTEKDTQGSNYSIRVHFDILPNRDRWSLTSGDCIHNLRSALDHLVYAIAVHQTKISPPAAERKLQFPITDDATKFSQQKFRIASLSPTVGTAIESVQPYNRTNSSLPPFLSLIRDFDDRDKHRLLGIAISRQQQREGNIHVPPGHILKGGNANAGDIADNSELMAFAVEPPSLDVKYDYKTALVICLRHAPGPTGIEASEVPTLLALLCEKVRTIVQLIGMKA